MFTEIDVVGDSLLNAADQFIDTDAMTIFGRANEIVVTDVESFPEIVIVRDDAIGELDRQHAFLRGAPLDFLSMLVGAGEEPNVVAHPPPMSRDHIGDDVLVHVADVREVVDVMDRGGEVELFRHQGGGFY